MASSITPPLMDPRGLAHRTTADDGVFETMACGGWLVTVFFSHKERYRAGFNE